MKLIPSLLAQAVKLSMITICMFSSFYTYLQMAQNIIGDAAAMVGGGIAGKENVTTDSYSTKAGKEAAKVAGALGGATKALGQRSGNRLKSTLQNAANYKGGNPLSKFTGGSGGSGIGGGRGGGASRFTSNNPQNEAVMRDNEERQDNQHSMNYTDHVTSSGIKSTFSEYLKDQMQSGYNFQQNVKKDQVTEKPTAEQVIQQAVKETMKQPEQKQAEEKAKLTK